MSFRYFRHFKVLDGWLFEYRAPNDDTGFNIMTPHGCPSLSMSIKRNTTPEFQARVSLVEQSTVCQRLR